MFHRNENFLPVSTLFFKGEVLSFFLFMEAFFQDKKIEVQTDGWEMDWYTD
jgi:hypothetical protein